MAEKYRANNKTVFNRFQFRHTDHCRWIESTAGGFRSGDLSVVDTTAWTGALCSLQYNRRQNMRTYAIQSLLFFRKRETQVAGQIIRSADTTVVRNGCGVIVTNTYEQRFFNRLPHRTSVKRKDLKKRYCRTLRCSRRICARYRRRHPRLLPQQNRLLRERGWRRWNERWFCRLANTGNSPPVYAELRWWTGVHIRRRHRFDEKYYL